jgi:plasmid stabilization system protein ParE
MPNVTWSVGALADIDRIDSFLRDKSPDAAERAISIILKSAEGLRDFPSTGRPVAGMNVEYRELPILFGSGGYLVYYRERGGSIHILAVRHMRERGYSRMGSP